MKYYIMMTNTQFGTVSYKRYNCIDGFSPNTLICWKFSKQGALKIIERLKYEYNANPYTQFSLEKAE